MTPVQQEATLELTFVEERVCIWDQCDFSRKVLHKNVLETRNLNRCWSPASYSLEFDEVLEFNEGNL